MPARPYREPVSIEPDPPPDPAARIGGLRSIHAAPPLHRALVGPVLIAALVVGAGLVAGGSLAIALPFAAATFVIFAWSPLRMRGFSAALHANGLVLSLAGAQRIVAFEDVNEVWFEVDTIHSQSGAYLRALRLLDFDGAVHRVPLAVNDGAALAGTILGACSGPLLAEAKQALREGATLTFGRIQLDRQGITVAGARSAWSEIRQTSVSHAKVLLYRRWPIVSWKTVSLDRIPNPAVFVGLVLSNAVRVQIEDPILVPFGSASDAGPRTPEERNALALRNMLVGGIFFLVGLAITWVTYSANNNSFVLAYGPILFGAVRFYQGLSAFLSGTKR